MTHRAATSVSDFEYWWRAARAWWIGIDPYTLRQGYAEWGRLVDPFFYPGPALMVSLPLGLMPLGAAAGLFMGVSCMWLAWVLTRDGTFWKLLAFASPGMLAAVKLGQWPPLLIAAILTPTAAGLISVKPSVGAALWLGRPTWSAVLGGLLLALLSLLILPGWPVEWWQNLHLLPPHTPPILTLAGLPIILTLRRWRDHDARFVVFMACVPQIMFFADQLPLVLVARTRAELVTLVLSAMLAFVAGAVRWHLHYGAVPLYVDAYTTIGCYWPAAAVVLFRGRVARSAMPERSHLANARLD